MVYLVVAISSSNTSRKPTFLGSGNMGCDSENENRRIFARCKGPLINIDFVLKGNLYGGSVENDCTVDTDVAEAAEEEVESTGVVGTESGSSIREGVNVGVGGDWTLVVRSPHTGRLSLGDFGLCVFLKVFRAVGEVADSVSNRKLVDPLPYTGLTFDVLRESLGRFEGDGPSAGIACALGAEGSIVNDMVLSPIDLGV